LENKIEVLDVERAMCFSVEKK